jgi:hypothetical protein
MPFTQVIEGDPIFLVSNIGVVLLIAFIKSRYLLGPDFLKTLPLTGAASSSDMFPPFSSSTEEHSNRFLQSSQNFDSL